MITIELVLSTLSKVESKSIFIELSCNEIISSSKKYSPNQIEVAKNFLLYTDSVRKAVGFIFELLKNTKQESVIWMVVKVASDAWLKELMDANCILDGYINNTYVKYIKNNQGQILGVEDTKLSYRDYVQKLHNTPLRKFLIKLFNPFGL